VFIGAGEAGLEYRVAAKDTVFLPAGCHVRSRVSDIPPSLPPGVYRYRAVIEFCGRLRCEEAWISDVLVTVTGRWPLTGALGPQHLREPF
jgi:hypothetical protein